jgi:RND family efflux transporter MFP subunit
LARQLSSLQIDRDVPRPPAGIPGWVTAVAVVLLVLALAGGGVYALRDRFMVKHAGRTSIVLVQPGKESPLFVSTGTVVAATTAYVAPRAPGRLESVLVSEGDRVRAGQTIAILESADRALAVKQAEADVTSAEARLGAARVAAQTAAARLARAQTLARGEALSKSAVQDAGFEVDGTRAQVKVSEADVAQARSRHAIARKSLDDMVLKAPFGGTVLLVMGKPGDFVTTAPGQGVIRLADLSTLEVDAEVSEPHIGKVGIGTPAEVQFDAAPGLSLVGRVFAIRPFVDPGKATAVAKLRVKVPPDFRPALFPGMNGRVSFVSKVPDSAALRQPPRLEVAAEAIVETAGGKAVYAIDKTGVVIASPIKVLGSDGDRAVIDSTLPAGTEVISEPAKVKPGDRIEIEAAK